MLHQLSEQRLVAGIIQILQQRIHPDGFPSMSPGPVLGLKNLSAAGIDLLFGNSTLSDRLLHCRNGFVHIGRHQQNIVSGANRLHLPDPRFKIAAQAFHIECIGNDEALESHLLL